MLVLKTLLKGPNLSVQGYVMLYIFLTLQEGDIDKLPS